MPTNAIALSVIIPVYNSAKTIAELVETLSKALIQLNFEIILINDYSADDSEFICENIAYTNERVQFISLRKNFGEHNAVLCGLNHSQGDYAVIIDDDFQNPPYEILKLYKTIVVENFDVVYSKYISKKQSLFRRIGSNFHNFIATFILDKPKNLYLSSFKIIKKEVYEEIINYKGPYPYIDGLLLKNTDNIGVCTVEHKERKAGKSNYTLKKLINLYLHMFINHSIKPMRLIMLTGIMTVSISILILLFILGNSIILGMEYKNTLNNTILYISLSGVQLLLMGMIGEYLVKNITSSGGYPQYSVKTLIKNKGKSQSAKIHHDKLDN